MTLQIANCGEVCASQLVLLRHKPREDDDDCNMILNTNIYIDLAMNMILTIFVYRHKLHRNKYAYVDGSNFI